MIQICISSDYQCRPITIDTLDILKPQSPAANLHQPVNKLIREIKTAKSEKLTKKKPKRISKADKLAILDTEIRAFLDNLYLTNEEWAWRGHIIQQIDTVVHDLFGKDVSVMCFGSSVSGLSLPWGDLDIALLFKATHDHDAVIKLLQLIEEKLNAETVFEDIVLISGASVPVLKFQERLTKIKVDVSVNNSHGKETTMLIKGFGKRYPVFNDLVLLLKHYLWERNVSESLNGGINTYLLSHMVVNMFQNSETLDYTLESTSGSIALAFHTFLQYYAGHTSFHPSRQSIVVSSQFNKTFAIIETQYVNNRNTYLSVEDLMVAERDIGSIAYRFGQIREMFECDYFELHLALSDGMVQVGSLLAAFVVESDEWQAYREQIVAVWQGMCYCEKL